ncbi:MAG: MBL fold metallo-hydrolase [Mangrovibacterium sp.]
MIEIKKFTFNYLQENTLVLYDETKACVIVDPGNLFDYEHEQLDEFIAKNELRVEKIINTHGHFDHLFGINYVRKRYGVPFLAHEEDNMLIDLYPQWCAMRGVGDVEPVEYPDFYLNDGDVVKFGNSELKLLHVPGHSPGSLVIYSEFDKFLIAGDVLFQGSIGRTDLPNGNFDLLISGIKNKLLTLPDEVKVYCGHGAETSIGAEKRNNPFLT